MASELSEKQWYIVTAQSTRETKARDSIIRRIETMGMQDYIFRVLVAEVEVPVLDKETNMPTGKTRKKNLYPGYVFVEMIMTDESWYIVRNTPDVTGIVGSKGGGAKPTPVSREEIEPVLKRLGYVDETMFSRYKVGDEIKIISGPFEGTEGIIESIDMDTHTVRINYFFFGRNNVVEVNFSEIDKIN